MRIVSILFVALLFFGCKKKDDSTNPVDDVTPLITDGLIGYWPLDNNAYDYSGNNLNGKIINTNFSTDKYDEEFKAAYFNSSSIRETQTIKIKDQSKIDLTNSFTISSWVYVSESLGNSSVEDFEFISKWGAGDKSQSAYVHGITGNRDFYLGTYDEQNTTVYSTKTVPTNTWIHLLSTFDNGTGMLYMNGELVAVMEDMDIPTDAFTDLTFGARQNNLSTFHGKLDEVYIFDRILDVDEIDILYND